MNLWRYLRDTKLCFAAYIILVILVNILLLVSTSLEQSAADILYLDFLLGLTGLFFALAGYFGWKNRYFDLFMALKKGEDFSGLISEDNRLENEIIRSIVSKNEQNLSHSLAQCDCENRALQNYITRWAHEIKIPLSVCELQIENEENAVQKRNLEGMSLEVARIRFLVNQVLYASRTSNYAEDLQIDEINLDGIIRDAVRRNSIFFYSKNIEIKLGNISYRVLSDQKGISYILDQLLHNASKYTGEGGKVEIDVSEDQRAIILYVRDNGIGIPEKDIDRVFDQGFTGENGRKTTHSTGMGLYFSKLIADSLGHTLTVNSRMGEYTEFIILFYKFSDYYNVTKM